MKIEPSSSLLQNVHIRDLVEYLRLTGWESAKAYSKRVLVFKRYSDIHGAPLEIVLPVDDRADDKEMYLASALNLLSALNEATPEHLAQQIALYDHDLLRIRNVDTEGYSSIEIPIASTQVIEMNHLITYALCSEYRPRPYFTSISRRVREAIRAFRFGHTFPGSFGFTIESRVRDGCGSSRTTPLYH